MIAKLAAIVVLIIVVASVAGCTINTTSPSQKPSPAPTLSPTPTLAVPTPTPTEQIKILFFESDNAESAAMQPVIAKLAQEYDVTFYNLTANPGYILMARFEYSVTQTPTIVVLYRRGPFESQGAVNIVGVHSYDEVVNIIENGG